MHDNRKETKVMSSLNKTASWVIIRESTGEVICETFNPRAVELLKPGFKAVPILEHLQSLNETP